MENRAPHFSRAVKRFDIARPCTFNRRDMDPSPIRPRRPDFDFSQSRAHWAPNPEFAQIYNAISVPVPYLERFLNKVMARAAALLGSDNDTTRALKTDIRAFIRQESNHYTLHDRFNEVLRREGYDIASLETMIEAEYERIWTTKSFAFCLAYCEGFETLGPPGARTMLDGLEDMFDGADPEIVSLWKWHLMEEFEHRTVCYDAFKHFHGGYFLRVYALAYQAVHLHGMVSKVLDLLIEQDRSGMSAKDLAGSDRRIKAATNALRKNLLAGLLRALLPWYSPRRLVEPRNYRRFMAEIEPRIT